LRVGQISKYLIIIIILISIDNSIAEDIAIGKVLSIKGFGPIAYYEKGVALYHSSKYNESIESLDNAIEINPNDTNAWYYKGVALYTSGSYNKSIQAYEKAIEVNPKFAEAWCNKGLALYNLGKCNKSFYGEAIQAFDEAIGINPNIADAWNNKGSAQIMCGKYNESTRSFEKAIERDKLHNFYKFLDPL
jgi:tetratricopeptide (TPR) repeat protein